MTLGGSIGGISESEAEDLREVINTGNREAYRSVIPPEYFKEEVLPEGAVPALLESMAFYGFRHGGRLVGVAALTEEVEGVGRLRWMYVRPQFQRMGVGTALVRHLEERALEVGYCSMRLRTADGAHWAVSFYEKLGYRITGRNPRPWGADILMERSLVTEDSGGQ